MYKVIFKFKDKKDKDREYEIGDVYPAEDAKQPSKKRLEELLGTENAVAQPVIEEIVEETDAE